MTEISSPNPFVLGAQLKLIAHVLTYEGVWKDKKNLSKDILEVNQSYGAHRMFAVVKDRTEMETRLGRPLTEAEQRPFDARREDIEKTHSSMREEPVHVKKVDMQDLGDATIVRSGGQIHVVFPPTTGSALGAQWSSNLTSGYRGTDNGHVHEGFASTLDHPVPATLGQQWQMLLRGEERPSFQQAVESEIRSAVDEARKEGHSPEITLSGISRGGALSQLAAEQLLRQTDLPVTRVYAFSSPMVGDPSWSRSFEELARSRGVSVLSMEVGGDIVTQLPPIGYERAGDVAYFPRQVGQAYIVTEPPISSQPSVTAILNPSDNMRACDNLLMGEHGQGGLAEAFQYHGGLMDIREYFTRSASLIERVRAEGDAERLVKMTDDALVRGGSTEEKAIISRHSQCVEAGLAPPPALEVTEQDLGTMSAPATASPATNRHSPPRHSQR